MPSQDAEDSAAACESCEHFDVKPVMSKVQSMKTFDDREQSMKLTVESACHRSCTLNAEDELGQSWCISRAAQALYTNPQFLNTTACLIACNAILIGVQADWLIKHVDDPVPVSFIVLDTLFAVSFAIELTIRILAEGRKFCQTSNVNQRWNMFDSFLVAQGLVDELLKFFVTVEVDVKAVRALRLLRLVRVARIL